MPNGVIEDGIFESVCQQLSSTPVQVTLSTSAAKNSSVLSPGRYRIVCTATCFVLQGGSTVNTTLSATSAGHLLPEGLVDYIYVTGSSDGYLAGIVSSGAATLCISKQ